MKRSPANFTWFGSITVVMRGPDVSRCISDLQRAGVTLRYVRVRQGVARCDVGMQSFDAFYRTCRNNQVRFRIEARHGVPFLGRRLWRRKTFTVGALLFVALIYSLSSMVWRIDITGPSDEDGVAQLRDAAAAAGLYVGQAKRQLSDPVALAGNILKRAPDFVWVGVQTTGSVTTIQAIPKVAGTKPVAEVPHDIVATQPAVIRNVAATRGRVVVKANQYVHPGQVLISGTLSEGEPPVPASGRVLAEVWYTSNVAVPLHVTQDGLTGESVSRNYLDIGAFRLRIWGWQEPHFQASYERDNTSNWHIGNYQLPVQWTHAQIFATTRQSVRQSTKTAEQLALELATSDVQTQAQGEAHVLGQSVLHRQVAHGTLYETVLSRVEQDIGVPSAISAPAKPKEEP